MEPNKIEKQFRKKLNSREIKPSEAAWDRLDAMLSVGEEKKEKRGFGWIYIAASVIGFLFIATVFLTQTQELTDVEVKGNTVVTKENNNKKSPETIPNATAVAPETKNPVAVEEKNSIIKKEGTIINQLSKNSALPSESEVSIHNQKTEQSIINPQSFSGTTEELITSTENPKIKTIVPVKSTALKVDPNALLSQVDGELELSFREKVIRSVGKKYRTVKVAVSSRNNQE